MLGPLLGGSSYTFGLILAVALLGIGARRPALRAPARGSGGPTLLVLRRHLRAGGAPARPPLRPGRPAGGGSRPCCGPSAALGFPALVAGWTAVTALVVLPAAVVAGYQFPLLIALLGSRPRAGWAARWASTYAANTLGAIVGLDRRRLRAHPAAHRAGRLAAGRRCCSWRWPRRRVLAGLRAARPAAPRSCPWRRRAAGLLFCLATGPTAFWRHTPIGAGRVDTAAWNGPNDIRERLERPRRHDRLGGGRRREQRRPRPGRTSTPSWSTARPTAAPSRDAPTQVMSGLVGALLHPDPRRVAGDRPGHGQHRRLAGPVPSIERVDVVELEPAILHVARVLSAVNHDVARQSQGARW